MSASLEGLDEVNKKLKEALENMGVVNQKALKDVALDLLGKSVELAPVDTGDLRGSGNVQFDGDTATVGFNEPYAVKQHEHTEYKHPQGGQAKYLEQPYRENVDKYINYIADANRNALK